MIYTIPRDPLFVSTLEQFDDFSDYLDTIDESTSFEDLKLLEKFVDTLKIAIGKDTQEIIKKYKDYASYVDSCKNRIKKLETNRNKSKINLLAVYEYYEITMYNGSGYTTIRYSRKANFITDIFDIVSVANKLDSMPDEYARKEFKYLRDEYANILMYNGMEYKYIPKKGTVYDCAKSASDKIEEFKKTLDKYYPITEKLNSNIQSVKKQILADKQSGKKPSKWLKKCLGLQKQIYQHNSLFIYAMSNATYKQLKVLNKFIKRFEDKL